MKENIRIDYSIIIPAYNEEEYLPKTMASLKESMNALSEFRGEIVVTNNNSTDRTAAIAEESGPCWSRPTRLYAPETSRVPTHGVSDLPWLSVFRQ